MEANERKLQPKPGREVPFALLHECKCLLEVWAQQTEGKLSTLVGFLLFAVHCKSVKQLSLFLPKIQ